jgi:2'-5' RNA ligase
MEKLFFGIVLEASARSRLASICRSGIASLPGVSWDNDGNYPIVLKSLGELTEGQKEQLQSRTDGFRSVSFVTSIKSLRVSPFHGSCRAIYADVDNKSNCFTSLFNEIITYILHCSISIPSDSNTAPIRPSIRLGRNHSATRKDVSQWIKSISFNERIPLNITECHLLRSVKAGEGGTRLEIVHTYPLSSGSDISDTIHKNMSDSFPAIEPCPISAQTNAVSAQAEVSSVLADAEEEISSMYSEIDAGAINSSSVRLPHNRPLQKKTNKRELSTGKVEGTTVLDSDSAFPEETLPRTPMERIFIGIKLPVPVAMLLQERYAAAMPLLPGVKWEKEENLHITMRFIGDMTVAQRQALQKQLQTVAVSSRAFASELIQFSMFSQRGEFRILHGLIDSAPSFRQLRADIDACISSCGIAIDSKDPEFIPHVTLAKNRRAKRPQVRSWIDARGSFAPIPLKISEFQLFQSTLSSEGSTYHILQSYSLLEQSVPEI